MEKNIKDIIAYSEGGITSKEIGEGKINTTLFCMAKGTEIGEHTSTKQGIIYVIEGSGEFNLEGNKIRMEEGKIIFMKENAKHFIKAKENTSFLLLLS